MYALCGVSKKKIFVIIMLGLHIYLAGVLGKYIVGFARIKADWTYYVQFVAQQYETQSNKSNQETMILYSVFFEATDSIFKSQEWGLKKANLDQYMSALKAKLLQKSNMDERNELSYSFCVCIDDYLENGSADIPVELIIYGGSFCSFHMGNVMGDDTYADRKSVLINNELSFLLYGSECSDGMSLKLHEEYYYVSEAVNDGRSTPVLYIPWDTFEKYIGKAEGIELNITCLEILIPEQYEGEGADAICEVFGLEEESDGLSNKAVNEGNAAYVKNTGRFSFSQILRHLLTLGTWSSKLMSDTIQYPYWEIAAAAFIEQQAINLLKMLATAAAALTGWCVYILQKGEKGDKKIAKR